MAKALQIKTHLLLQRLRQGGAFAVLDQELCQFADLMDDDKKHLIVARLRRFEAPGMLAVRELIELDLVGVIKVLHNSLLLRAAVPGGFSVRKDSMLIAQV